MVLAGIECSPKIFDFRASGIPVQERVDFLDTLKHIKTLFFGILIKLFHKLSDLLLLILGHKAVNLY